MNDYNISNYEKYLIKNKIISYLSNDNFKRKIKKIQNRMIYFNVYKNIHLLRIIQKQILIILKYWIWNY